jgi:hypothetical protein
MLRQLALGSLSAQPSLRSLNLSGNLLDELSGLAGCSALQTLLLADNRLQAAAALEPLAAWCPSLESLDLQNNLLEDGEAVLAAVARLPRIKCLYLKGNKLVSSMRGYRKAVIAALPGLTYLDDRPVFEVERLTAEAWWVLWGEGQACVRREGCNGKNPDRRGRTLQRQLMLCLAGWGRCQMGCQMRCCSRGSTATHRLAAGQRAAWRLSERRALPTSGSSRSGSGGRWRPSGKSGRRDGRR